MCNELAGHDGGSPVCSEVLKMGFSHGRKRLQLTENTHHPLLSALLRLYLQQGGLEGTQGLRSWSGCEQSPGETKGMAAERCSGLGRG